MTKRHLMTLRLILLMADALLALVVFLVVSELRFDSGDPDAVWSVGIPIPIAGTALSTIWVAVLWLVGLYRLRVRWSLASEARDIARATVMFAAVTLSMLFLLHQDNVSRLFLALFFVALPGTTLGGRAVFRYWFDALRRQGRNRSYMLVAGTGALAQSFADAVEAHPSLGMQVVGHLTVPGASVKSQPEPGRLSRPILGSVDDIGAVFAKRVVDEVAVCLPSESAAYLDPIVAIAADAGKTVRVPTDPSQEVLSYALREDFDGFIVRSVVHDSQRDLGLVVKRLVDIVGAAVGLVVLSPVTFLAAVAIRTREGPPILFRQTRIGRHGRPFTIYKFRTMVRDAEAQHTNVIARNPSNGAAFRFREDPRVTDLGRFLRRSSIDEIPQLINVLRGEMSLVGPRPPLPREVDGYDMWHRRRLSMRPGMTGLWQVEARLEHPFDEVAELDLQYIDQWSLWNDLRILARTVPAVLFARGR